ncbi:3-hydroxyacyl-CoA dehydrogenase family protein [Anaerocolumna sedimenticola]|uniref:3-hydroxyacyl-CoA dehydrogenase family protein n=1 Tax=Anaerocolumna sedimenticola TaxID=2696063 RepID=A0A6P1THK6_9FIRM|nr:3-hydroxyacyl-CoA dehydrogenase family protein [Anaerocolumna sedimenticola]QHQ60700.1 3-hydroxyacyl-CoA dehydrogenase family protein [Anaerocolumna sedimenticola]
MIKTITVIGANGTMGYNISGIFASFGNAEVYMICRNLDDAKRAVNMAAKSVKAEAIKSNLIPADYSMLENCISSSDLIFESVSEDIKIKEIINSEIAKYAKVDAIISTGTSGLSINKLAESLPASLRTNYLGIHFYNPPYSMTLCELIPSSYTNSNILNKVNNYVTEILYRTAVVVKDSPAFLGNRIGFQFINEALQYAEKYKDNGGIDYIDAILGQFSGRSMAPLITSDFVGLDVHKAIVDNLYINTNDYAKDTFILPQFAFNLIKNGKLGRKTNGGLYKLEVSDSGLKKSLVYDINTNKYRDKYKYSFPFVENMILSLMNGEYAIAFSILINNHSIEAELCLEFLIKYVLYSLNSAIFVADDFQAADDVMANGFNWCPPLAIVQALFGVDNFRCLVQERINHQILEHIDMDRLFNNLNTSTYDYRRYFKAKH